MLISQILIVDDEPDIRTMLSILLKKQFNVPVQTSPDIQKALTLVQESDFNVAFLDISLKNEIGYELIAPLRKRFGQDIKIIMISAFDNEVEREKVESYGANLFVGKPLTRAKIKTALVDLGFTI